MNLQWLASSEWANIVKALLHTLWQGAVIAVLLGFALRRLDNPVARYRCSLAALGGVMLAGLVTWAVLNRPLPQKISNAPAPQTETASAPVANNNLPPLVINFPPAEPKPVTMPWSAWLAMLWLAGATAMIFRAGFQVAGAEQLRRASRPLEDAHIAGLLDDARRAVGLARRVRIAVTDKLTSPAVVGVLVPTLILPLSLTTTLTPEQIRFVLLHELAHIRRGDYLASLFQLFAEALLFFNPAVWWISRHMRIEREACCDTLAVELSGAPVDYARTLVHVAENILTSAPAAALAFGDKREPSSLADRVQRMLVPGYRPALRLTWRAMLVALLVGGGLLFLSALGTRVTVAAILSPQERIERIEKKMTELGEKPVADYNGSDEKAPQVKISGEVRTADGTPVPKWVQVNFNSSVNHSSYGTMDMARNGFFTNSIRAGTILISAEVTNFAPAFIAPLDGLHTNLFFYVVITLERGFDVVLQVVDADSGQVLTDAKVVTIFWMNNNGFQSRFWKSGADGSITLTHCADLPMDVTVNAPGYEITQKKFDRVRAGEPLRVSVRHGATVSGVLLDKTTGQPVAGAELRVLYQAGTVDQQRFNWDDSLHALGKTDSSGAFVLDQLRRGVRYYFGISAPGHESLILKNISAGQSNLVARLGPELVVRGHVIGSLESLQQINKHRALYHSFSEIYDSSSFGDGGWVPLRVTNGVASFQFTNRLAGLVKMSAKSGGSFEREVSTPVDDWVIDLNTVQIAEAKVLPKREVIFRFKHPSGVPPRGTVEVTIPDNLEINHLTAHMQEMEITNGEVRVPIAIGGRTSLEPKRMVGYWFNSAGERGSLLSIQVTNGTGPIVIEIPLVPAGAIYAQARNADGTPAGGLGFGVNELKRSPGRDDSSLLDRGGDSYDSTAPRKWISGPLPLGGTYQIYGWRGNSFCVSKSIKLTEASPDAEVELQFAPGKKFMGVVLDADGKPLRDAELKTSFTLAGNHGFGLKSLFTNERGWFELENATPDMGEYSVEVDAPGMMAERMALDFGSQPQTIRLKRGRTLGGRVVEAGTGYPIPGMEVRALDYDRNKLPMLTTHTDADGRFEFTTLGDVNYTLYPDGGELLGRPASGNLKFRADGRTNLTLTVKLYEWSKLKPKAPAATAGTMNTIVGILTDPNFREQLHAIEQRGGFNALTEPKPVITTTIGRGINRISADDFSAAVSNAVSESSSQPAMTFKLDHPIRSEDLKKQLLDSGVKIPPTVFFYNDSGVLLVRGSQEQLALVNRAVLKLNGNSASVIEADSKTFIQRTAASSTTNQTSTNLFTRTFKVDTNAFLANLKRFAVAGAVTSPVVGGETNPPSYSGAAVRNFFSSLGVNFDSPPGKAVFYKDRTGILLVKATTADLDTVDRAIQALNYTPPQIHIKARFVSLPKKQTFALESLMMSLNASTHELVGIMNHSNLQTALKTLASKNKVEILAEPEVTTLSGRQAQVRVTDTVSIITNMTAFENPTNHVVSITPQVSPIEVGVVLDVVPHLLADGHTLSLGLKPSWTEFNGYAKTNTHAFYKSSGERINVPGVHPLFNVQQLTTTVNLWDGQTAVLGGMSVTNIVKDKIPLLGDLPWLGSLFRKRQTTESDILVFITATIVDPAGNRVHADDELPFAQTGIPPQPPQPK